MLCVATDFNSVLLILLVACTSVSIVTGLRAGRSGVRIPAGARDFSFFQTLRPALGPLQLSFQLVRKVRSSEIKRPGREAGH